MKAHARVESRMKKFPVTVSSDTRISRAQRLMKEYRIRHLPVTEGKKIIGVVSERDLLRVEAFSDAMILTVGEVMVRNPYIAKPGASIAEITRMMATEKYGCTVVVDESEEVVGIFTTTDALVLLTELLVEEERAGPDSGRTIIEWFEWDASMGE